MTTGMSPKAKNQVKQAIKAVVVLGLLYLLAQRGLISISMRDTSRAFARWELWVPAFIAMLVNIGLGTIRWQWLLKAQSIHLPLWRTFQLSMLGNFFNIALPGAVSGDFVKAFYIGREVQGMRARAFGSILFDRVAGLSALCLIAAAAMAMGYNSFVGTPLLIGVQFVVIVAASSVILFYAYLFLVRERHDPFLRALKSLDGRFPKLGSITRIYEGLRHYHNHRGTVLKVLLISVLIHLIAGWCCLQFAHALGEEHLPLLGMYVVVPLGLLVTAVPVMPAGIGTGHAAFFYLFKLLGSERGADVYTFFALFTLFFGGLGGIFYMRFKGREPIPEISPAN